MADSRARNNTAVCECGGRKLTGRQACDRCVHLDGYGVGAAEVIWALRGATMTLEELSLSLDRDPAGIWRILHRLERYGRVRAVRASPAANALVYYSLCAQDHEVAA